MEANVPGFHGPLSVMQFKGGQSNPTYRLGTPLGAYVLRRKPFGPLLPGPTTPTNPICPLVWGIEYRYVFVRVSMTSMRPPPFPTRLAR